MKEGPHFSNRKLAKLGDQKVSSIVTVADIIHSIVGYQVLNKNILNFVSKVFIFRAFQGSFIEQGVCVLLCHIISKANKRHRGRSGGSKRFFSA